MLILDIIKWSDNIGAYIKGDLAMVLEKIREVVAKKFKVQPQNVNESTRLREDLNVDSLDAVELIMELEDTFNVKIADDEAQKLKTIGDIVNFLTPKVK